MHNIILSLSWPLTSQHTPLFAHRLRPPAPNPSWFCSGRVQTHTIAKIAGPGRKRHTSDPDPSSGSDSSDGQPVCAKCLKMASSSSSSAAGGETAGHRGGAQQQQRGGSGRDGGTGLPSSTSKKKQKDRANQESREAKRAAGANAEPKKGKQNWSSIEKQRLLGEKIITETVFPL